MPPIVKENETSTATATAVPSAVRPAVANSAEVAARPQPVALEVPVSVNGARTVEGTDKREPFSENTKTVLVFGNGAVIRLTSNVAPGQLLFLTNDKTKKEVVCQVVKSKNYRNVSGYVELEFTEAVVGFWGMRFPTDRIGSQPAPLAGGPVLVPPAAPKVAAPAVSAPVASKPVELKPAQAAPVVPAPAAPKPAAEKIAPPPAVSAPPTPPAVEVAKVVAPAAPIVAPPTLEEFMVAASSSTPTVDVTTKELAANAETPAVADSPKLDVPPAAPVEIAQSIVAAPEAQAPALLSAPPPPVTPSFAELSAALTASLTSPSSSSSILPSLAPKQATPAPSDRSMDELKQETARLQQQLAALLFTDLPATPAAPKLDSAAVAATTEKLFEIAQTEPAPAKENKPAPAVRPLPQPSFGAEEVKIPSWLEPLARNTPSASPVESVPVSADSQDLEQAPVFSSHTEADDASFESSGESALETPSFGSRYSHEENQAEAASSSGSKKGLWIGIAAGVLLLAGGAAWYFWPASSPAQAAVSAASHPAPGPAPSAAKSDMAPIVPVLPPASSSTSPSSANVVPSGSAASSSTATAQPGASNHDPAKLATSSMMPADRLAALANAPKPQPEPAQPEQPKKPVMGDVRLAAPVMNRQASKQDSSESAPELEGQAASASEDLSSMAISNGKQPAAPLPVGGDVKPAVLLSSVPPVYPPLAKTQHVNGDVKIDAFIDATGHVTATKVLSGPTLLHQSAMAAVKQWRYQPATLNGNAVPMHLTVTLQFRLQ